MFPTLTRRSRPPLVLAAALGLAAAVIPLTATPASATAWTVQDVAAPMQWNTGTGEGIVVGVTDTGIAPRGATYEFDATVAAGGVEVAEGVTTFTADGNVDTVTIPTLVNVGSVHDGEQIVVNVVTIGLNTIGVSETAVTLTCHASTSMCS